MEFLVHIEQDISPDMDSDLLTDIKAAERVRGQELIDQGVLRRIWRVPGRRAVTALYEVDGPEALHEALSSLPLFPWMDIEVVPLAAHALDPGHP